MTNEQKMREDFEIEFKKFPLMHMEEQLSRGIDDSYKNFTAYVCWKMWQAAIQSVQAEKENK